MAQNIQELTSIIFQEGVQKGEEEASRIVEVATEESEKIVNAAKTEAEKIIEDAKKESENLKKINESEIKLAGLKAVRAIRQQITEIITAKALDDKVQSAMSSDSIKEYIKTIVQNWNTNGAKQELQILLPEKDQEALKGTFTAELSKLMKEGIDVSFSKSLRGGFQIGPKDGSYKISLTEEDFNEFFKQYLSAKTRDFLFSS